MNVCRSRALSALLAGAAALALLAEAARTGGGASGGIGSQSRDWIQPGTQPFPVPPGLSDPLQPSSDCLACHAGFEPGTAPGSHWVASMKAQTTRNPMVWATVAIANQDAGNAGYLCFRCHAPNAFLGGRTTFVSDGSIFDDDLHDFDGVGCNFCHRLVDPIASPDNPDVDQDVLPTGQYAIDVELHGGIFALDLFDRRRGPRDDLGADFAWHQWLASPFHEESLLCASCHDVSNPLFRRERDGGYVLTPNNEEHPTHEKRDVFPLERTFSEWALSDYAVRPIDSGGRFGGVDPLVSSCQDCHMPKVEGHAALPELGAHLRADLATHGFNGANTWSLRAVRGLFPDGVTGLSQEAVDAAAARTQAMHAAAAELETWVRGGELVARVVNHTGHKLPTGFVEGRRMWLHVVFRDARGGIVAEQGHYDHETAELTAAGTRVWEAQQGVDAHVSALTGIPVGHSFHMAVNNVNLFDNRIPPRGYDVAAFDELDTEPIGQAFAEQQFWDEVGFPLPPGAAAAELTLYYQQTSKEFIEFVRDANVTNDAGQIAYDAWLQHGKSAPVPMASASLELAAGGCPTPIEYGIGKTSSIGGEPRLRKLGFPTLSDQNFRLQVRGGLPGQFGVLFWSQGTASAAFHGGKRYLALPMVRHGNFTLGATGQAVIPIQVQASMVGQTRHYQAFFRDPGDATHFGITSAIRVDFCD